MRYGIISDIHSNLEALRVALDSLQDVDEFMCVGDIVGYGANPNECCEVIRDREIVTVLGNHDAAIVGKMPLDWFNPFAREAAEWTRDELTTENRVFLENLPLIYRAEHLIMVHGSLSSPEQFEYISTPWEARSTFAEMVPHGLCFIGHTHAAEYYLQGPGEIGADQINMAEGGTIDLKSESLYVVNCGSVGQPRDYNPKASVGIYDVEAETVEIRRLDYPIAATQEKMQDAGLPGPLWTRLQFGV